MTFSIRSANTISFNCSLIALDFIRCNVELSSSSMCNQDCSAHIFFHSFFSSRASYDDEKWGKKSDEMNKIFLAFQCLEKVSIINWKLDLMSPADSMIAIPQRSVIVMRNVNLSEHFKLQHVAYEENWLWHFLKKYLKISLYIIFCKCFKISLLKRKKKFDSLNTQTYSTFNFCVLRSMPREIPFYIYFFVLARNTLQCFAGQSKKKEFFIHDNSLEKHFSFIVNFFFFILVLFFNIFLPSSSLESFVFKRKGNEGDSKRFKNVWMFFLCKGTERLFRSDIDR